MKTPDTPPDEWARLEALHGLEILDTPQEERYDAITRDAKKRFGTDMAFISMIDRNRQWLKSAIGLDAEETDREISFCDHAIRGDEVFVVGDATKDERFADNPLVTDDPRIRFYAGAPLHAPNGARVGTLCVLSRSPREFTPEDRSRLRELADRVELEFSRNLLRTAHAGRWRKGLLAITILETLLLSFILFQWSQTAEVDRQRNEFLALSSGRERMIQESIVGGLSTLHSMAAFFASNDRVREEEFATFAKGIREQNPAFAAIAWIPFGSERARDPIHRSLLEEARRTDKIVVSERVQLRGDTSPRAALLAAIGVRRKGRASGSDPDGFVVLSLRVQDLFRDVLRGDPNAQDLNLILYDLSTDSPSARLLFSWTEPGIRTGAQNLPMALLDLQNRIFWKDSIFLIEGRRWKIRSAPTGTFLRARGDTRSWLVLGSGALLSGVLAALFGSIEGRTRRVERAVEERTTQLREEILVRRRAEKALRVAKDSAEEANRAKSSFLAKMSHELRTPLNSIIGFSGILLRDKTKRLGEEERSFAERIRRNGLHLLSLVNDILDLSKIEAARVEVVPESVDLAALVREVFSELEGAKSNREVSLRSDLAQVPPCVTDRAKLRQILVNLVGNALKFTPRGEVRVRLSHDAAAARPFRLEVADTGIGIPEDRLAAIFDPFVQGDDTTSRKFGGTGLGLAISRSLVEILGGRLEVASREGAGSDFRVLLPERPPASADRAAS